MPNHNDNQEKVLTTDQQTSAKKFLSSNKNLLIIVAVAILITIIAGGIYYYTTFISKSPATYSYTNFDSYTVKGAPAGSGISFRKPVELKIRSSATNQVELIHAWKGNNTSGETYIAALSQEAPFQINKSMLSSMDTILSNPKNQTYESYAVLIEKFVEDRMPLGWQTKLSSATTFKTPNIKNNAWSFGVTSTHEESKLRGKAVLAVGKNTFYYFLVTSNSHNWQTDQSAWDRTFNSLKIDQ